MCEDHDLWGVTPIGNTPDAADRGEENSSKFDAEAWMDLMIRGDAA